MRATKLILFSLLIILKVIFLSCADGKEDEDTPFDQNILPTKAMGVLPANGEPCSDYQEISDDDSKVLVDFRWNMAQFAKSYVLTISEGTALAFSNSLNTTQTNVTLNRGTTYTWWVTSVNDSGETAGDTYSFTTPGIPEGNFAPYAAEIEIEFDTSSLEMLVAWIGRDEEDDILKYDVVVKQGDDVLLEETDTSSTSLAPLNYINGTEYSVEVKSTDTSGSFSFSTTSIKAPD